MRYDAAHKKAQQGRKDHEFRKFVRAEIWKQKD